MKPIIVKSTEDATECNKKYGERYGIDWEYETPNQSPTPRTDAIEEGYLTEMITAIYPHQQSEVHKKHFEKVRTLERELSESNIQAAQANELYNHMHDYANERDELKKQLTSAKELIEQLCKALDNCVMWCDGLKCKGDDHEGSCSLAIGNKALELAYSQGYGKNQ